MAGLPLPQSPSGCSHTLNPIRVWGGVRVWIPTISPWKISGACTSVSLPCDGMIGYAELQNSFHHWGERKPMLPKCSMVLSTSIRMSNASSRSLSFNRPFKSRKERLEAGNELDVSLETQMKSFCLGVKSGETIQEDWE